MIPGLGLWNRLYASVRKGENKMKRSQRWNLTSLVTACAIVAAVVSSTGCQTSINGQTLPSPYYLQDDVQYFPSGPEFKLPREAAALRAAKAEEQLRNR